MFFLGAALVCFALIPVGLEKFQHVAELVGIVYLVLAALSFFDARGRARSRR
jgi:hypothetical protein